MKWTIFAETLRRQWRGMLLWSLGLFGYGILTTAIVPDPEGLKQMASLLNSLPAFIWQALGVPDVSTIATPLGIISLRYFLTAVIVLSVWGVLAGMSITLNDETSGISDMLFSLPVKRGRVVAEKLLAMVPLVFVLVLSGWAGLAVGMQLNPYASSDLGVLLQASLNMVPITLFVLALTTLLGSILPRKALVGGIAGGFLGASFMLNMVGNVARSDVATALQQFSVFHHAEATNLLLNGYPWSAMLVMLAIAAGLAFLSVRMIDQRDLGS